MISVEKAKELIQSNSQKLPVSRINIKDSLGSVLATDIIAPVVLPPFNQSAMDGYAIVFSDYNQNSPIKIVGEVAAGKYFKGGISKGQAVRIFTGAPVPNGADTVVMQEKVKLRNGYIVVEDSNLKMGANIRKMGSQITKGSIALNKITVMTPGAIGYLAAMGINSVKVISKPKVTIVVTGSELKKPGSKLLNGQILCLEVKMVH